jgi:hypothetical protein
MKDALYMFSYESQVDPEIGENGKGWRMKFCNTVVWIFEKDEKYTERPFILNEAHF